MTLPHLGGGSYELDLEDLPSEARAIIEELRSFKDAAIRILLAGDVTGISRDVGLIALLALARKAAAPDLAVTAILRAEEEWALGRGREAWYWEAAIEEAVVRDVGRGRLR
jgi:hypothetical protein